MKRIIEHTIISVFLIAIIVLFIFSAIIKAEVTISNQENNRIETVRWIDSRTFEELFNINDIVRFDWDKQILN